MKPPLTRWPEAAVTLARTFGVRGAAFRARHEVRRSAGRFREAPRFAAAPGGHAEWLVVDREALRASTDVDAALARADRVVDGAYEAFRHSWRPFPTTSPEWLRQPTTGRIAAATAPWWEADHLDAEYGDIKEVWEPARFAWLYDLVRGYVLTRDDRYARSALERIAQWSAAAPPFKGLHWSCGQETTIRAVALLYAEANLAPTLTPVDRTLVRGLLAASGERIADAIGYAVSQRNNHAISEAAGLALLGARFKEHHPEASTWFRTGHRWLERLIPEQFAEDGWYIQHSFTYARLALDQCVLAEHALRSQGVRLSDAAVRRLLAAKDLLVALVDSETGHVPNHGANDGAFVFPATLSAYRDFRPVLTAVASTWEQALPADIPADTEVPIWLGMAPPAAAPARRDDVLTGASGWAVARLCGAVVFLRAGQYTSRPAHLDPLQLDVRFDAQAVVVDAGSFSYNAPQPWKNGLAGASVHNGPLLDGQEPGLRGPRFLWYLWPQATIVDARMDGEAIVLVAERPGVVRRTVHIEAGWVEVRDRALAEGILSVAWLVAPGVDPACIQIVEGERADVSGAEGNVEAWMSPHYGERIPSQSVIARSTTPSHATIVTRITPPDTL